MSAIKADKRDISEVKLEKFTYQWTIKNFSYLHMQPGEKHDSPVFSFGSNKINWFIRLHPYGKSQENKDYLSLYLIWNHKHTLNGVFKLSLINIEQQKVKEIQSDFSLTTEMSIGYGYANFIKRDELLNDPNNLLPNDCLTVNCDIVLTVKKELELMSNVEEQMLKINSKSNLLEKLFLDMNLSDIKLIATCGKSLSAHRNVLAACSPVFKAMFTHDMLEQKLGEVKIVDGEYEVIKEMLRFIYLDRVDNIESNASELLKLADKYQIAGLTEFCTETLKKQITTENVLEIIDMANLYQIENLKTSAINFVRVHIKDVIQSDDFKSPRHLQALQNILEAFAQQ